MIFLVLSLVLIYLLYTFLFKPNTYWKERNVPHIKPVPIFGNLLPVVLQRESLSSWIQDLYVKFENKRYFGVYQFSKPQLVLRDINLIKQITIKDFDNFVNREMEFKEDIDPVFSKNLVSLKDQKWKDRRAALSPCFTSSKMKFLYRLMYECATKFTEYLKNHEEEAKSLEMKNVFSRFATDVIATSAFGITIDSLHNKENEFFVIGNKLSDFSGFRLLMFLLYASFPFLTKVVKVPIVSTKQTEFFQNVITETLKVRRNNKIVRPDLIELLLQFQTSPTGEDANNKKILTDTDIIAQGMVFFLAGFESISTTLSFLSYELVLNQDIQKKLQEEIDSIISKSEGQVPYNILINLNYLDMVVSECLRKWPPAVILDRKCSNDYKIEANSDENQSLTLQKGTPVLIPIGAIHRDKKFYPDPEIFDPERFSEENKHKIISGSYIPFGSGPRNCIASRFAIMEIKIAIFHLLSEFDIIPIDKTQIPVKMSKKQFMPYAEDGIWLGFKKREN